jgi:hypothetical protein
MIKACTLFFITVAFFTASSEAQVKTIEAVVLSFKYQPLIQLLVLPFIHPGKYRSFLVAWRN